MRINLRIFLFVPIVLFQLFWAVSCQSEKEGDAREIDVESNASASEELVEVEPAYVDSAYLRQLEEAFLNETLLSNYQDSVPENYSMDNSFVEVKLDMNGDGVEDYVVLGNSFHHVWGDVIDGKTGKSLALAPDFVNGIFWNRPYPHETTEGIFVTVMDASCNDNQKDLQVIYQSGCTPGSASQGAYLEIYHYNTDSSHVELILNEQISYTWDENDLDTIWNENYEFSHIDHLFRKRACCEEIVIAEGVGPSDNDVFNYYAIQPKEGGWTKKMVYNQELQTYLEQ